VGVGYHWEKKQDRLLSPPLQSQILVGHRGNEWAPGEMTRDRPGLRISHLPPLKLLKTPQNMELGLQSHNFS
jgi:hypothetical protein